MSVLGVGEYGCVVTPATPCRGDVLADAAGYVTKVMLSEEDADKEADAEREEQEVGVPPAGGPAR